ncbi:MAG: molybdopterin-dependent oxidoreductase [Planctomycetes bacterium]|nr:molybdopterin-dependent oxidoreductase [Planctomycetota bacterium]MCH9724414.1 molybdopterin-dependent oxidoreductase [Planctomycetota bacterium]MCH9776235.1 molybdopterin-dependent oxidoreductase [Planctomycetota bacterium]MCH9793219.1 molybdopterin-dependent oxidoreductase [Planctomycetota bacterium]
MADSLDHFLAEHSRLSRRYFLRYGVAGAAGLAALNQLSAEDQSRDPALQKAIDKLETNLTVPKVFRDVSRGNPKPHSLSEEKRKEVGLTRDTWSLEVISDPENKARLGNPLTKEKGTALNFEALLKLGEKHAIRFSKVMTCLNIRTPLGTGIWEGVPLREILWLTKPRDNIRRVFYNGYHNDDPKQIFKSSLPIDRVLEDPDGLPPVILCYKLNGEWLTPERGAPVRMVIPESYGFKNIKWLTHIYFSNLFHANDTYANGNNDIDSTLKTYASTLSFPKQVKSNQPIPITGYAQAGTAGLAKVQVWIQKNGEKFSRDDRYFTTAPWVDAEILSAPTAHQWGGDLPDNKIPIGTIGFDNKTGKPNTWPMPLMKAHWAILMPALPAGKYTLRCRTIDANGKAQPMPRPFRKSGHVAIEQKDIVVTT